MLTVFSHTPGENNIGRSKKGANQIVLEDHTVSSKHCVIGTVFGRGCFWICGWGGWGEFSSVRFPDVVQPASGGVPTATHRLLVASNTVIDTECVFVTGLSTDRLDTHGT